MELDRYKPAARLLVRISAVSAAVGVLYLSLASMPDLVSAPFNDKVNHFIAYATLAVLFTGAQKRPVAYLATMAALIAYGVAIEWLQAVGGNGRQASLLDAAANTAGVVAGSAFSYLARHALRAYSAATTSSTGTS
ncbi:MAG: VanZ family protein [Pseudomonadota bacterium]